MLVLEKKMNTVKTPVLHDARKNESIMSLEQQGHDMNVITHQDSQMHDKNFRYLIRIRWLIKAFLSACLPKRVFKFLDMDSLQILDGQLITRHSHRNLNTDFVCRINLKDSEEFVILLIEHQSSADKKMPAKILQYSAELIKQYGDSNQSGRSYPLIIPIVFYTGKYIDQLPKTMDEITFGENVYDRNPINAEFHLVTPKNLDCSGIEDGVALSLFAQSFVLAQNPDAQKLFTMMKQLEQLKDKKSIEFRSRLEEYLFREVECKLSEDDSAVLEKLIIASKGEHNMPTFEQILRDIFEKQGRQEGRLEGKLEGKKNMQLEIAEKMIQNGIDPELIENCTGLDMASISQFNSNSLAMT